MSEPMNECDVNAWTRDFLATDLEIGRLQLSVLHKKKDAPLPTEQKLALLASLRPTERELFRLLQAGYGSGEIAFQLAMDRNAVPQLVDNLCSKLQVSS